jgi:membrane fusion protein, multidrug efflux system
MKRRWPVWLAAALVALLIAGALARVLADRSAKQRALVQSPAATAPGKIELAATDIVKAEMRELVQGLPVSGALRAVNSAVVKARVPGELRGLTVREGDFVTAGQIIARIDDSEYQTRVRQASEQAASSKTQIELAQRQFDNNQALVEQGFISKTALDNSIANLNAAKSTYQAAVAATDIARKSVADAIVKSPIAGQVAQRFAQPGERVGIEARIVEIVDLRSLELEASLGAADSLSVRVGQAAELQAEGRAKPVLASVARINPSAQAGSRGVLVYLSVQPDIAADGNAPSLRQGMYMQGTLATVRVSRLSVPISAVRTDKPVPYVQAIENGQIVHRTVDLGERGVVGGEMLVSVTGLADQAALLRGHIGALREGTAVVFTRMASPTAASAAPSTATAAPPGSKLTP